MSCALDKKAVCLFSGGLDSILAVCLMREQGVIVHGIAFESALLGASKAKNQAQALDMPLRIEDFTDTLLALVRSPRHGLGSCMNPCIDCHIAMLERAGQWMEQNGFDFLVTGEVLGERPMSQGKKNLALVARESGYEALVLRPLSAKLLPETEPEKKGWVNRELLHAIEGRSRKPQMALAARFGIRNYPQPAGGCLLTDPEFAARLRDLLAHEGPDARLVRLLRKGRHFRFHGVRLVVGRNEMENTAILGEAGPGDAVIQAQNAAGPVCLAVGAMSQEALELACAICARYSDVPRGTPARVSVQTGACSKILEATPASEENLDACRIAIPRV